MYKSLSGYSEFGNVWKCLKMTCKDVLMTMINDLDRLRHWWRRVEVVQVKVCIFEGG
jgi:hypothetical protein